MPTDGRTNGGQNRLDALSTESLENMLHDALFSGDDSDRFLDLIDSIIAELDRRNVNEPPMSAEESYKEFLAEYAGKESLYLDCAADGTVTENSTVSRHRHRLSTVVKSALIAAAMVIAVMASMIAVQAAGIDVFGSIARWTADVFGFGYAEADEDGSTDDGVSSEIPSQFEELRDALAENGMPMEYVPTYWPEGYGEANVSINKNHIMTCISCNFPHSTSGAVISFSTPSQDSEYNAMQYNKDGINPIIYENNGLTFYIMENKDFYLAVCNNGVVEISIFGISEEEDIINIIKSIGA